MKKMSSNRNRLVAPRNVVNTKMLYTFYILKELAKGETILDRKSTRLNSSHITISYAVFCLKKFFF